MRCSSARTGGYRKRKDQDPGFRIQERRRAPPRTPNPESGILLFRGNPLARIEGHDRHARAEGREGDAAMPRISPFLWFDDHAEEAVAFYTSIFENSKIKTVSRYGEAGPGPKGQVMVATFELDGQTFMALNGGPQFRFTPAVSFLIHCKNQKEVDHYWDRLSEGGQTQPCGWLQDKFGVSWQVVPTILGELLADTDRKKADRVMKAMLKMSKIDIAGLERAAAGAGE
jgi:predicted 3-demethylubiquinone-9 3-methyltransferase (glyoxalase superfamily)